MGYRQASEFIPTTEMWASFGFSYTLQDGALKATSICQDDTEYIYIPVVLPGSDRYREGTKVNSIEIHYTVITDDLGSINFAAYKMAKVANGDTMALTALDLTADIEDGDITGDHMIKLTLDEPLLLQDGEAINLYMTAEVSATGNIAVLAAWVNYEYLED